MFSHAMQVFFKIMFRIRIFWFQCGSGSSFLSQMRMGSGSRESDFYRHKKLDFDMKKIYNVGNMSQNIPTSAQKPFWKAGNEVYLLILVNFHVLHPDPHSQYVFGSGISKSSYTELNQQYIVQPYKNCPIISKLNSK
jgi:hypothetical protein